MMRNVNYRDSNDRGVTRGDRKIEIDGTAAADFAKSEIDHGGFGKSGEIHC